MGKIFWSKIDRGAGAQENRPGWEGRRGMEGGSSKRWKQKWEQKVEEIGGN